jgi:hypothetical protein
MLRAGTMLLLFALPAVAEGLPASLYPRPRPPALATPLAADTAILPGAAEPVTDVAMAAATQAALDAVSAAASQPVPESEAGGAPTVSTAALAASPFPRARPPIAGPAAEPAATPRGNGICGNPALTGQMLDRIGSRTNGCGVDEPVQITAVDGITLTIPATMDCPTANALAAWVDQGLRPAFGAEQVVGLQVAGHYICRTRNHIRGARISEHGRGKAIDISGIILASGQVMTVASNWNRQMRAAYQAGCGIFGTTLGPGSDGYHEDHMHFDTASHRNGAYCR